MDPRLHATRGLTWLPLVNSLNGVWSRTTETHSKGGFYHDGRFATLADVVTHYDTCFSLGLTAQEQSDVVEYMKSLPRRR
jgi:cytochrome c peroxidase